MKVLNKKKTGEDFGLQNGLLPQQEYKLASVQAKKEDEVPTFEEWYKKNGGANYTPQKFGYGSYGESARVKDLYNRYNTLLGQRPDDWTGGQFGDQMNDALNKILNRDPFKYDLNADMLYQQYKENYIQQGRQAMVDTMGQAQAMTGGYGNSYAQSVGQQAYNNQLQQLNNIVPSLYELALEKWKLEGQNLEDQYGLIKNQYDTEYGQYMDKYNMWDNDVNRAYNTYDSERNFDYGKYADAYNRALSSFKENESNRQYAASLAAKNESEAYGLYNSIYGNGNKDDTAKTPAANDSDSASNLKETTPSIRQGGLKAFRSGGINALKEYVDSYAGYNIDEIMNYVSPYISDKEWDMYEKEQSGYLRANGGR